MNQPLNRYLDASKNGRDSVRAIGGQVNHYVANCASADCTIPEEYLGCRYLEADSDGGIIKVTYTGDNGVARTEVKNLQPGEIWRVSNVTIVHRYYVDTTPCTTQVYTDAGVLVTGIKLRF